MEGHVTFGQWLGNAITGGTLFAAWAGVFPTFIAVVASIVALVWYLIQISESATAQRWLANRRTRKVARLRARAIKLAAAGESARAHLEARALLIEAQGKPPLPGLETNGFAQYPKNDAVEDEG